MGNPGAFKDKVVLDVGTGSGILAIWAAKVCCVVMCCCWCVVLCVCVCVLSQKGCGSKKQVTKNTENTNTITSTDETRQTLTC